MILLIDLDGTLIDTAHDRFKPMKEAIKLMVSFFKNSIKYI